MEIGAVVCRMLGETQGIARGRGEARWRTDDHLQMPSCCLPSNRNWWRGIISKAWEGDFMTYYFEAMGWSRTLYCILYRRQPRTSLISYKILQSNKPNVIENFKHASPGLAFEIALTAALDIYRRQRGGGDNWGNWNQCPMKFLNGNIHFMLTSNIRVSTYFCRWCKNTKVMTWNHFWGINWRAGMTRLNFCHI